MNGVLVSRLGLGRQWVGGWVDGVGELVEQAVKRACW